MEKPIDLETQYGGVLNVSVVASVASSGHCHESQVVLRALPEHATHLPFPLAPVPNLALSVLGPVTSSSIIV